MDRRAELLSGSPREVLARIVPGDPLGIRELVGGHLRSECLFLDADRVHLRALARIARHALRRGTSHLDGWLGAEVAGAAAEILREEAEAPQAEPRSAFVEFARPLGLDPEALRRGCAAFHHLPHPDRAAFFALLVLGVGLEAHARATQATPSEVGRRARRALGALLHASHPALPPAPASGAVSRARPEPREESR
ncbi:MAG: hypothetical protein JNK02_04865 [Planctomycetes bacterium]|nr:hypothetical protein [Planctomycetota bacterium]